MASVTTIPTVLPEVFAIASGMSSEKTIQIMAPAAETRTGGARP